MRVPKRKTELLAQSKQPPEDHYLTPHAIQKMRDELERLVKKDRPEAAAEVRRLAELGDFSENAAYQMAKGVLRRINARITTLEERLKTAIPIEKGAGPSGQIRLGSSVVVRVLGKEITLEIVGAQETNPSLGRISYLSPLGEALLGHKAGDSVSVKDTLYAIVEVS
jgi:transcription elongation GreA/GreB family factor